MALPPPSQSSRAAASARGGRPFPASNSAFSSLCARGRGMWSGNDAETAPSPPDRVSGGAVARHGGASLGLGDKATEGGGHGSRPRRTHRVQIGSVARGDRRRVGFEAEASEDRFAVCGATRIW